MKNIKKALKYSGFTIVVLLVALVVYIYSLTYTPHGRMLWQQAAYAKFFHKVLNIQTEEISGLLEKDLKSMKPAEILPQVENYKTIKITADSIPLHIYIPHGLKANSPIIIYYHGGGFMFPYNSDAHVVARKYANAFNSIVVGVDYRVTPKYTFPIPINDSYQAFLWIIQNGASLGGNPNKITVIGESAGGNISAVVAQKSLKDGHQNIKLQVLICPTLDIAHMSDYPSYKLLNEGYILDKKVIDFFFQAYLPNKADWFNVEASPLLSESLTGLPSAFIITAQFDPIRDEGLAYYNKLQKAGVKVKFKELQGVLHVAQGPLMGDYIDGLNAEINKEIDDKNKQ